MPPLPLRLAAEAPATEVLGPSFCLQAPDDEQGVCIIADSAGIAAVAVERPWPARELAAELGLPEAEAPRLQLVRERGDAMVWHADGERCASAAAARAAHGARARPPLSRAQARRVVKGIDAYYARAVLEPAVRGFLSILEKQFPRSDLYLFELLQNAVDDGARTIRVDACARTGGLTLRHDGRRFSPLDALGLASVGLSTKGSASGGRRTIGFMGVGFKAVYKRFARVVVRDRSFRFAFDEATTTGGGAGAASHAWVMQPKWEEEEREEDDASDGCHFSLEKPRGGSDAVRRDLKALPTTCRPLRQQWWTPQRAKTRLPATLQRSRLGCGRDGKPSG